MKKALALIILLSMLVTSLAACSEDAPENVNADTTAITADDTTAAETTAAGETGRADAVSTLDESIDLGGMSINVGYVDHMYTKNEIIGAEDGDVVNEAVFQRNLLVEDDLNVKLVPVLNGNDLKAAGAAFKTVVLAGDQVYDIHTGAQCYMKELAFEGMFTNMINDPYISYDSPWWASDYMAQTVAGNNRIFMLYGDLNLGMLKNAGAMYFNKPLFENHFMKVDEFYDMVFAGDWVFDKFYEYTSSVYTDLNGDGQVNIGDLFGLAATTSKTVEHLQYNAGVTTTSRDKDGIPYISLNNEKTIKFVEKLYNLYYVNPGARIYQNDAEMDKEMLTMFKNDQMLFNPNWFHLAEKLRDMETDFGIVTYPKYDESQEDYKTLVHDGSSFFCVPVTIGDEKLKVIGAVLEDMSYHAYRLITPAYFEVALKAKYSRDDVSSQMLDLMASSLYTDFAYVYSSDLNDIGMLRPLMKQKTSDFASWYAGVEEGVLSKFDQLLDVYLG